MWPTVFQLPHPYGMVDIFIAHHPLCAVVPRLGFEPRSHRLRVWYNNHYTNRVYKRPLGAALPSDSSRTISTSDAKTI